MTYALIDNSTLTAIQRLTGQAPTKSRDSTDTDIVAFENYIQAILFYDRIIAIDDYIPKYRTERINSFPKITFLNKLDYKFDSIEAQASERASLLRPKLKGGEFVNEDFKKLIELLQTHIICTWDISSSIYHLTLKNLSSIPEEFQKYSNIAAAIFSELTNASETGGDNLYQNIELIDRFGNPINKGYLVPGAKWGKGESSGEASEAIKAFVASLVWLSNRSIYYSLAGKYLQADTFLYPIRQAYQQIYISETCNYGFNYAKHIVEHFSTSLSNDIVDIHNAGLAVATSTTLPVFSAWLAKETGNPKAIEQAAYELRVNPEFIEAREQIRKIRRHFDDSEIIDANNSVRKLMKEINKASNNLRIKYGIQTRQGVPVTKLVQVYNSVAALKGLPAIPSYNFSIKFPEWLYNLNRPRGFCSVYRNLAQDLATIWSLGEARDILGSQVNVDVNARSYKPKQEQLHFRNSHSQVKSPM